MENDKYVVFKSEELIEADKKHLVLGDLPEPLKDAVVIRLQDVFAGPGLFAYASAIQTAIDIMDMEAQMLSMHREETWSTDPRTRMQLEELRDFFAEQAQLAVDHPHKKIPD
jgi:hypothetical protein